MNKDRRNKCIACPPIDGTMQPGLCYMTKNSRIDNETIMSKEQMTKEFISRYGVLPEKVFYGKPNGTLICAGPVPEKFPELRIFDKPASPPQLQPEQLSFTNIKDFPNGNYY